MRPYEICYITVVKDLPFQYEIRLFNPHAYMRNAERSVWADLHDTTLSRATTGLRQAYDMNCFV